MKYLAVLLFLFSFSFGVGFRFLKLRERTRGSLACPKDRVILIRSASYGAVKSPTNLCHAPTSFTEVSARCNSRQTCSLVASNGIFGDPCRGTKKLLTTAYSCIPRSLFTRRSAIVCENRRATLRCPPGHTISLFYASYGRSSRSLCPHKSIRTTRCHSARSSRIVARLCQGRRSCDVFASNRVFGDPCRGTFKYLEVRYRCRSRCRRDRSRKTVVIPERRIGGLRCPRGGRIRVLRVLYGNARNPRCRRANPFQLAAVQKRCQGIKSCVLWASNNVFGDPCRGIVKSLTVSFKCNFA